MIRSARNFFNKNFHFKNDQNKNLRDIPPEIQSDLQIFQKEYQLSDNELGEQNNEYLSIIYSSIPSFPDFVIETILQREGR